MKTVAARFSQFTFLLTCLTLAPAAFADSTAYDIQCMGARDDEDSADTFETMQISAGNLRHSFTAPNADITVSSKADAATGQLAFPEFKVKSQSELVSIQTKADDFYRIYNLYQAFDAKQPHGVICTVGDLRRGTLPEGRSYKFGCTRRNGNGHVIDSASGVWDGGMLPLTLELPKKNKFFRTDPRSPEVNVGITTDGRLSMHLKFKLRGSRLTGGTVVEFQPSETRQEYTARFVVRGEDRPKTEVIDCRLKER